MLEGKAKLQKNTCILFIKCLKIIKTMLNIFMAISILKIIKMCTEMINTNQGGERGSGRVWLSYTVGYDLFTHTHIQAHELT